MANNREGYADYKVFNQFSYKIIEHLMDNNEEIWKLLKHITPDAWSKPDLTANEKAQLIYDGSEDTTDFKVFLDDGIPDVYTREDAILRISPFSMFPENRTIGTVMIRFEVYAHWKVNHLSNYTTRVDSIIKELLGTLNGSLIDSEGSIGRLYFNRLEANRARMETTGQIPFKGKVLFLANKSG